MKVTVKTQDLQKKLSFINHAVSTHSQIPILSHILLEVTEDKLYISSTDLEIGIRTALTATETEEGGLTVPAKTFFELISSLPDSTVTLTATDTTLEVVSKKTKSKFQTISKEEFPKLYDEQGSTLATITTDTLKEDVGEIIFSASTDTTRPALSGVLVKKEDTPGGGFLLVATDGYRLSLKHSNSLTPEAEKHERTQMIMPARIFREMLALRDEGKTMQVFISPEKNQILFAIGETILVGRLIEAEYPNYERIIPTDHSSETVFDREELLKAVKICSIFARETANIIKLSLKNDKIVVSSQTPSLGENTVDVEAKLTGEENEIAFNAKYLLDVLANITKEELFFQMSGPLNPGVFKLKEDPSFLHLIMPIRIQS